MGSGCVAQLVERSLLIPEVRGLNPVIGKNLFISNICLLSTVYWKDKNKEKEAGNGSFKKKYRKDARAVSYREHGEYFLWEISLCRIYGVGTCLAASSPRRTSTRGCRRRREADDERDDILNKRAPMKTTWLLIQFLLPFFVANDPPQLPWHDFSILFVDMEIFSLLSLHHET